MKLINFIILLAIVLTTISMMIQVTDIGYVGEAHVMYERITNGESSAHKERTIRALKTWAEEAKVLGEEEEGWW